MKNNNILARIILLVWVLLAIMLIIVIAIVKENVAMHQIVTQIVRVYGGCSVVLGGYICYLMYRKKK